MCQSYSKPKVGRFLKHDVDLLQHAMAFQNRFQFWFCGLFWTVFP